MMFYVGTGRKSSLCFSFWIVARPFSAQTRDRVLKLKGQKWSGFGRIVKLLQSKSFLRFLSGQTVLILASPPPELVAAQK